MTRRPATVTGVRPRLLLALSTIATVAAGICSTSLRAQAPPPRHVVVVSVDGMKPAVYLQPGPSQVPTLRRLMTRGAYGEVVGVLPTVTAELTHVRRSDWISRPAFRRARVPRCS
jgi:hypothetical protein